MHFPKSRRPTELERAVVKVFSDVSAQIDSSDHSPQRSDEVLLAVAPGLRKAGFRVEASKKQVDKVSVPVLFGRNGKPEKSFDADAHHIDGGFVVEVEAGRAVDNNQFLKDLFQACMMDDVRYLALAVRNEYRAGKDFETLCRFFETLYASRRLDLPLKGILVIGY